MTRPRAFSPCARCPYPAKPEYRDTTVCRYDRICWLHETEQIDEARRVERRRLYEERGDKPL